MKCYSPLIRFTGCTLAALLITLVLFQTVAADEPPSLETTWKKFVQALLQQNEKKLQALSTDCIYCAYCLVNTNGEYREAEQVKLNNPQNRTDSLYDSRKFVSMETFIREDIPIIADNLARAALRVDSLHSFIDNDHNARLYQGLCIMSGFVSETDNYSFREVAVKVPGKERPFSMMFAFINTPDGYRFCGYSTVP